MVIRRAVPLGLLLLAGLRPAAAQTLSLAALAQGWPQHYVLTGSKTEPTYIEQIRLARDGAVFDLQGGAPQGMAVARETVQVGPQGLAYLRCPVAMRCAGGPPSGFLASALVVAALRDHRLGGRYRVRRYGARQVVCVPAAALGIAHAVLDPCVDTATGVVLAQLHRRSGHFDGPSLDPTSIRIMLTAASPPS